MATITISRLEKYPADEPTGHAVGFTVETSNGKSFYVDTTVSFADADDDDKAVSEAYKSLKDTVDGRITELEAKSSLLGTELTFSEE